LFIIIKITDLGGIMSITSVFTIGPFVACSLLCKILNMPVMSICRQTKWRNVGWKTSTFATFTNVFFFIFVTFSTFFNVFYFFSETFFTSMVGLQDAKYRYSHITRIYR